MRTITLLSYNLENFFLETQVGDSPCESKPKRERDRIGAILRETDADVLLFQELGSLKVPDYLNSSYLNDKYRAFLQAGNSYRGIQLGFLVKKNLPWGPELKSHARATFASERGKTRHSRDIPELSLIDKESGKTVLTVFCVHNKSKRTADAHDKDGEIQRRAETRHLALTAWNRHKETEAPIVLMGDFNGDASEGGEKTFSILRDDFLDCFDLKKLPPDRRLTFFEDKSSGLKRPSKQLDFAFLHKGHQENFLDAGVVEISNLPGLKESFAGKVDFYPSDHLPIFLTLKL